MCLRVSGILSAAAADWEIILSWITRIILYRLQEIDIMSKGTACSDPKGVAASVCTRLVSPAGPDTAQSPARDPFNSFHLHVAGSDFNQGCTPDARDLNLVQLLL